MADQANTETAPRHGASDEHVGSDTAAALRRYDAEERLAYASVVGDEVAMSEAFRDLRSQRP